MPGASPFATAAAATATAAAGGGGGGGGVEYDGDAEQAALLASAVSDVWLPANAAKVLARLHPQTATDLLLHSLTDVNDQFPPEEKLKEGSFNALQQAIRRRRKVSTLSSFFFSFLSFPFLRLLPLPLLRVLHPAILVWFGLVSVALIYFAAIHADARNVRCCTVRHY